MYRPSLTVPTALQETFGCRGWTWTEVRCQLFGRLGLSVSSPGSVSGPPSCTGLLLSGGYPNPSSSNSAEVFLPFTGQQCRLPEIPGSPRWYHTMDNTTLCGGLWPDTEVRKTCLSLGSDGWVTSSHLLHQRPYHSSWASPSGESDLLHHLSSSYLRRPTYGGRCQLQVH